MDIFLNKETNWHLLKQNWIKLIFYSRIGLLFVLSVTLTKCKTAI